MISWHMDSAHIIVGTTEDEMTEKYNIFLCLNYTNPTMTVGRRLQSPARIANGTGLRHTLYPSVRGTKDTKPRL